MSARLPDANRSALAFDRALKRKLGGDPRDVQEIYEDEFRKGPSHEYLKPYAHGCARCRATCTRLPSR